MIDWRIFRTLLLGGLIGALAVFPFVLTTQPALLDQVPFPLPVIVLISMVQTTITLSVAIFAGLFLAKRVGFEMPLIKRLSYGTLPPTKIKSAFISNAPIGLAVGVAIILGDWIGSQFIPPIVAPNVALWRGAIAILYGGIVEEILMRLFMMTTLVWVFSFIWKSVDGKAAPTAVWLAIIVAAILFGIGHLPATAQLVEITPAIIARAIILNGIGGIVFGWLYWRRGLGDAMIAHLFADVVLLIVLPMLKLIL